MQTYHVLVRNEATGELRVVELSGDDQRDAQVEALQHLFKSEGWRKAVALSVEAKTSPV